MTRLASTLRFTLQAAAFGALLMALAHGQSSTIREAPDAHTLLRLGDLLAEEGDYQEALDEWRKAYVALIPEYRDLEFLHPVTAALMDRDALGGKVVELAEKEYPAEQMEADRLALSHLGFFGRDLDLGALMTGMLTEEIAGFYDTDEKTLFLIAEEHDPEAEEPGWFDRLLGARPQFDPDEQKMVLAHELIHALADQNFDLYSWTRSLEHDDDASLAFSALVEGEAMMGMFLDPGASDYGREMLQMPSFVVSLANMAMSWLAPFAVSDTFGGAPLIFQESMLFPYGGGWKFCHSLTKETGDWSLVDAAYVLPPASTEQILHPEKYRANSAAHDPPQAIEFAGEAPLDAEVWERIEDNVVGEFATEVLFRSELGRFDSAPAAAGWDGDRYVVWAQHEAEEPRTVLVWASTWDTPEDAREFALALLEVRGVDGGFPETEEVHAAWPAEHGKSGLWIRDTDVWLVDDAPEEDFEALAAWCRQTTKSEKSFTLEVFEPSAPFPDK